jgi:two-component system nitrate/nitrite response regulator NarL
MDGPVGVDGTVIRIILADSEIVYRIGILQVVTSEIDMRVVAQATTVEEVGLAVERFVIQSPTQCASTSPVILLADTMLSGMVNVISELVSRAPQVKIIVRLDEKDEFNTVDLYRRGVRGIISRSVSPDLLVKCVRKVAAGETWIDNQSVNWVITAWRSQTKELVKPRTSARLSPKEQTIINWITQGKRNKEIAYELGTTEQVIKNCLRRVYEKLGVSDRIELAHYGLHHRLPRIRTETGFVPGASVPVLDIQSKLNGSYSASGNDTTTR